ncbi:aldo/keto reductase [Burkholderia sp. Bp8963]|nr:aldo/keto reductase [Burkholderia sp. Bp8963]
MYSADVYSFGASEQRLGQALKNLGVARKDVVIATMVSSPMGPDPNDRGAHGRASPSCATSPPRMRCRLCGSRWRGSWRRRM